MAVVTAKTNEPFESLVRRFKREVDKSGVLSAARDNQSHKPASVLKKERNSRMKRRNAKQNAQNKENGRRR